MKRILRLLSLGTALVRIQFRAAYIDAQLRHLAKARRELVTELESLARRHCGNEAAERITRRHLNHLAAPRR